MTSRVLQVSELDLSSHERPLQAELDSFLRSVQEGRAPEVSGEAGARALDLADRIAARIREQSF